MLHVDIISDFVCPWCWIGRANLARTPDRPPLRFRWHPYLLHPDIDPSGVDRRTFVASKFGSAERARELAAGIREAAADAGLPLDLDAVERIPDTRDAHRVMRWAQGQGVGDALADRLFRAHFVDGSNIGDITLLADIAGECGMDRDLVARLLAEGADREVIDQQAARARAAGISGVPTMILAGSVVVVGAQPPEKWSRAFAALDQAQAAAHPA